MSLQRRLVANSLALIVGLLPLGCNTGPTVTGAFDRDFDITGHTRLEVTNPSGDVEITGSADAKVHVHGDVRASGMGFDDTKTRLAETLANSGVEQRGDTIRVGKHLSNMHNVSIAYRIEVPHDTEVNINGASGSQTIRGVRGPVTATAASGSIRVDKVDRDARLTTLSGSLQVNDVGDDVRASNASGGVTIANAKGDVRVDALSGDIQVLKPGGRVEASSASSSIFIRGATADAKARTASGRVTIEGDPGAHGYWDLKTASGQVQINVSGSANFRFSADSMSGEIRTDIPIVIEEQGRHSLRAHVGEGGGRVEVHTVSGPIHIGKPD